MFLAKRKEASVCPVCRCAAKGLHCLQGFFPHMRCSCSYAAKGLLFPIINSFSFFGRMEDIRLVTYNRLFLLFTFLQTHEAYICSYAANGL